MSAAKPDPLAWGSPLQTKIEEAVILLNGIRDQVAALIEADPSRDNVLTYAPIVAGVHKVLTDLIVQEIAIIRANPLPDPPKRKRTRKSK